MISELQMNVNMRISREEAIEILNTPDEQLEELNAGGQGIEDTIKAITDAGFTYEIE